MKDNYGMKFDVDDDFTVETPEYDIDVKDTYYVGDRWAVGDIDTRRETHILSHLKGLHNWLWQAHQTFPGHFKISCFMTRENI
jgi:hypothetical protein